MTAGETGKLAVFVSHRPDDLKFADKLDAALRLCGFATNTDPNGIPGSELVTRLWTRGLPSLRTWGTVAI